MQKILSNYISFGVVIFVLSLVIGITVVLIAQLLGLEGGSGSVGIVAGMIAGQMYTQTFKKEIPKDLRIKGVTVFCLLQFICALALGFISGFEMQSWVLIILIVDVIIFVLTYFLVGFGSKSALKTLAKQTHKLK